jgi:hypothetical protein
MFLKNKKLLNFFIDSFSQSGFGQSGVRRPVGCLSRLLFNPFVEICLREPPTPAHLKGWNLFGSRQPADRSLGDLEVVGDFPDDHDGVVSWAEWHGLG